MAHEPLSRQLERLVAADGVRTLNELVSRTSGRGIFVVTILLCLPFATPIPLPGLSNIIGLTLVVVGVRLALGRPARLPKFIGAREWPQRRMHQVVRASSRLLAWIERGIKPRRSKWMSEPWAVRLNGGLFAFLGLLLALPIPPVVPFSNALPAYALILLSASMMEEDSATLWIAYALAAATVVYFTLFFGVIVRFIIHFEERIIAFLKGLL